MNNLTSPRGSSASPYQAVLAEDPSLYKLYPKLAACYPDPKTQAHILLKGAWHALELGEYVTAAALALDAHKRDIGTFRAYEIDLQLLERQNQTHKIPPRLQEIAALFHQQALPRQELKATKRLAQLQPTSATYEKVIELYTQTGKPHKAILWTKALAKLEDDIPPPPPPLPRPEPVESKQPLVKEAALPEIAFGKAAWEEHFGVDVGKEPPLPPDIDKILNSPCPFWPDKKVHETHLLTLIPTTVNGKPLTLALMGELVQKPLKGNATKYSYFYLGQTKDVAAPKAHWVLLTKDVLNGSRNKPYETQAALVAEHAKKSKLPYTVPKVLDAAVSLFVDYVKTGTYLYGQNPWTYTRCQEKYDGSYQLVVGGFAPGGLYVLNGFREGLGSFGVGCSREF